MYVTGSLLTPRSSEPIAVPPGLHSELWQLILSYIFADKRFAQVVCYATVSRFFLDVCLQSCLQIPLSLYFRGGCLFNVVKAEVEPFAKDRVMYQGQELLAIGPEGKHYYRSRFWTHRDKLYIFSPPPHFKIQNLNLHAEIKKNVPHRVQISGALNLFQAAEIMACQPCEQGFLLVSVGGATIWEFENDEPILKEYFPPSALGVSPSWRIETAWFFGGKLHIKQAEYDDRRWSNRSYIQLDVQDKLGTRVLENPYSFLRYPENKEFSWEGRELLLYNAGKNVLYLKERVERVDMHPFIFLAEGFLFIFYGGPAFKVIELATGIDVTEKLAPLLTHVLEVPESVINSLYLRCHNSTYFLELIGQRNKSGKEIVRNTMGELDLLKISLELTPTET